MISKAVQDIYEIPSSNVNRLNSLFKQLLSLQEENYFRIMKEVASYSISIRTDEILRGSTLDIVVTTRHILGQKNYNNQGKQYTSSKDTEPCIYITFKPQNEGVFMYKIVAEMKSLTLEQAINLIPKLKKLKIDKFLIDNADLIVKD